MSRSDYLRPAPYQVKNIWTCAACGRQTEMDSDYGVGPCDCGGTLVLSGESYPADPSDWDEERDSVNDDWHRRR